nr:ribosomal RNA processing protein 36 homolog [Ipomoea batatas]
MSSFVVVAEGIQYMWDEEVWALNLMSTSSIFTATKPDEIDRVYQDKLAGRDPKKGKGRAVDDDTPTPADLTKSDRRLIERVQVFSRFQVGFVDHNRKVGPSNRATQAEKSENTQAEDATPDVDDSIESSNSYYSGNEADNQLQMVVYQGLVDSTPLAQEDEELSRPVEVNGALNSLSQSAEIPRSDLQMVVSNNQTLPSPRDDEAPRIEDEPNPTPATQVDPPLEEEINLGPSPSSTGGENRDTLPTPSFQDIQPTNPSTSHASFGGKHAKSFKKSMVKEESGERFHSCNIPPSLKSKDNQTRQKFQWSMNKAIREENERRRQAEEEKIKRQEEKLEHYRKMKEKMDAIESIKKNEDALVKYNVVFHHERK